MDADYDIMIKLVIVGNSGSGKTKIIERFTNDSFQETTRSTIGVEFMSKNIEIQNMRIKCQIWDTAGQERYRTVVSAYYRGSSGTIVVYDICSKESFEKVNEWVQEIRSHIGQDTAILIIGNKKDQEHLRVVDRKQGEYLAEQLQADFIETSAKTGENVNEAFHILSKKALSKHLEKSYNDKSKSDVFNQGDVSQTRMQSIVTKSKSCCPF